MVTPGSRPGGVTDRAGRARLVVLAILTVNVGWGVLLPLALVDPPSRAAWLLVGALAAASGAALVLLLRAAVTPWVGSRTRDGLVAVLLASALALWPVVGAWAAPGQEPWAWLAGTVVGVLLLVLAPRAVLALGGALVAVAVVGAVVWGQSVPQTLGFTVGTAALVVLMGQVLVWLLRLLVAAEAGREAEAGLAVSAERLRLAQELHDLLGHRLTVIALRAEVAGDLVAVDPVRARAETEAVRGLAASTLAEVRAAVHGYGTVDLAEQLRTAELVLASAGIAATVRADAAIAHVLDPTSTGLLAAVVRESVTNLLRHSDAMQVSVDLTAGDAGATLVVVNDGLRPVDGVRGTGLPALAGRAARAGARLTWGPVGGLFEVRLVMAGR
ncbi:sensor histidine kinase [Aquipuribacter hungaricus]|uniref:histidine kinase n=2 Tax=Aquipuribacter hungaricus TaxID=545624 RepID=A0ABV7WIE9_9MICO